jgi:hypothetical protein
MRMIMKDNINKYNGIFDRIKDKDKKIITDMAVSHFLQKKYVSHEDVEWIMGYDDKELSCFNSKIEDGWAAHL